MITTSQLRFRRLRPIVWAVLSVFAAMTFVVAAAGCSASSRDRGRIRVSGSVSFDGKPLAHGSVLFAGSGEGDVASAPIRSDATFVATLLPGDYAVAVRCLERSELTASTPDWVQPKSLIPEKYTDTKTSGLKVTASAGMPPIRLDLLR
jgi:hypothetical protein